ncbi:hypothetical protein TRFO_26033 [Tritrichomonas foetus]|uniref:Uncharacterized protein n=1 Tax=Tritrichomonas foetus TaxID=1144522 RepID=A0A1J4K3T3_9EUKA|nr:hypothetical protein TRFO_26033 [Tritrichomonas foetus]|eukprot:OHT06105.1 hypothetical protein TRFO_26033 [Tritrichomonas foetus]
MTVNDTPVPIDAMTYSPSFSICPVPPNIRTFDRSFRRVSTANAFESISSPLWGWIGRDLKNSEYKQDPAPTAPNFLMPFGANFFSNLTSVGWPSSFWPYVSMLLKYGSISSNLVLKCSNFIVPSSSISATLVSELPRSTPSNAIV